MNIIYLTWGETPRAYGVFGTQVISQFVETKKIMPEASFHFISAIPLIHSGMVREKLNYPKELDKVRQKLGSIAFTRIPIYAPQNVVNASKTSFVMLQFGAQWHLSNQLRKLSADIIHCRGYAAAYAALQVRERYNLKYKIIFDGRGLWPEEVAFKKSYSETSSNYLYLKKIEQDILDHADSIVTVSDTMQQHYQTLTTSKIDNIYLSAPTTLFKGRATNKNSLPTLIYVGALSDNAWHKPASLAALYKAFRTKWKTRARLIIVTTSNHETIRSNFDKSLKDEITLCSTRTAEELVNILSEADFACLPYFVPQNYAEKRISETMLAVKTVEYLSAGLPVLCNKYCGGAAAIIKQHQLGLCYDPAKIDELDSDKMQALMSSSVSKKAIKLANKLFSYQVNAEKYKHLYQSL